MSRRVTRSGVLDVMAGCRICHGDEIAWRGKNAVGVAARHHDATGHPTWAEQVIIVSYGSRESHEGALRERLRLLEKSEG